MDSFRKWEAAMVEKDLRWVQFGAVGQMVLGAAVLALSILPLFSSDVGRSNHLSGLVFGMFWMIFGLVQFNWVQSQRRFLRLEKEIHELREHLRQKADGQSREGRM